MRIQPRDLNLILSLQEKISYVKSNTIYLKKSKLDQFYTSPEIAKVYYNKIFTLFDINKFSLLLEPSAGSGSFFNLFPKDKRIGLDLDPKSSEIKKMDFFDFMPEKDKIIAAIGNPPFGKNCSLAVKFFNQLAKYSDLIALILPKTFKKNSIQNKLDLNFHLISSEDLPKNSFLLNNLPYNVPCCFQIWERQDAPREKVHSIVENDIFEFTIKENADFAVRRVGGSAGKCAKNFDLAKKDSHYFLKSKIKDVNKLINFIDSLDFQEIVTSTAGIKSLSKPEFVEVFLKYWNKNEV